MTQTPEQLDELTLTDLEQVRVLADPLRLRIVEALCEHERTTKQVALLLGEKPTKLYHHVEALAGVGLIRQTRTQRNRGTLERYYLAVARTFRADGNLFAHDTSGATEAMASVVAGLLQSTANQLATLLANPGGAAEVEAAGIVSYLAVSADERTMRTINRRLRRLVEDLRRKGEAAKGPEEGPDRLRRYQFTLAFFPLDRPVDPASG